MNTLTLSNAATGRLFLDHHGLARAPQGVAKAPALLALIKQLGFVQLDSINTVARAHDLILFARRPQQRPKALKNLYEPDRAPFDHWAHGPDGIVNIVRNKPTGSYARRIWFLYEWLTCSRLNLPDAEGRRYVPVVNPDQQFATEGENAPRYRVKNNLPGTRDFCPLVFRTQKLDEFIAMDMASRARAVIADVPRDFLARTTAVLLLKDSRFSYAIEGERPPQDRIQRWGRAIGEAGRQPLDRGELLRLQRIVIGDARFIKLGFRDEGGFVGEHDRETRMPLPDHISARHEDLPSLTDGMIAFDHGASRHSDAIVSAAILAFGFVYIHPFEDGNSRLHRYLIHHVLAERGFNPPGVVFPVSSAILERIAAP